MQRAKFRSADDLFAQLPVRDVIRVLAKTKQDAEKKREELRDLVGQRYHDLIDSADGIISMNSTVTEFEKTLLTIEKSAAVLLAPKLSAPPPVQQSEAVKNEAVMATPAAESQTVQINFLLGAPSEIWTALDAGNELKACKILLRASRVIDALHLFSPDQAMGEEKDFARDGGKEEDVLDELARCAKRDAAAFGGEWQLKFPFLLSQAKLVLGDCRQDIIATCHAAFAERSISATRVDKAMQSLLLLKEVTNPTETLLAARTKLMEDMNVAMQDGEEALVSIAELLSRTVVDCALLQRHDERNAGAMEEWMTKVAGPLARKQAAFCCSRVNTLAALAQCEERVREAAAQVFDSVFASTFQARAKYLRKQAQDAALARVKRILTTSSSSSSGNGAKQALQILQKSGVFAEEDAAAAEDGWQEELIAWLEQNAQLVTVGHFCELLSKKQADKSISAMDAGRNNTRLLAIVTRSQSAWVEAVLSRLGPVFATQCELLPWHHRRSNGGSSSTMGGWQLDDSTHGELPAFPSWPCAELCFNVSLELDAFAPPPMQNSAADGGAVGRMLGEAVWKHMHQVYSALAKTATGSDGKLQAAFDLEYASIALLGLERPLLPFTNGGVDVYACASVLKSRAKLYANASARLVMVANKPSATATTTPGSAPPPATAVVTEKTANLLSIVQPVPRFALLPVPQRVNRLTSPRAGGNVAVSPHARVQQQQLEPETKSVQQQQQQSSLGRVLGWLS